MKKDIFLGKSPGYAKHSRNEGGRRNINKKIRRTVKRAIKGDLKINPL